HSSARPTPTHLCPARSSPPAPRRTGAASPSPTRCPSCRPLPGPSRSSAPSPPLVQMSVVAVRRLRLGYRELSSPPALEEALHCPLLPAHENLVHGRDD